MVIAKKSWPCQQLCAAQPASGRTRGLVWQALHGVQGRGAKGHTPVLLCLLALFDALEASGSMSLKQQYYMFSFV